MLHSTDIQLTRNKVPIIARRNKRRSTDVKGVCKPGLFRCTNHGADMHTRTPRTQPPCRSATNFNCGCVQCSTYLPEPHVLSHTKHARQPTFSGFPQCTATLGMQGTSTNFKYYTYIRPSLGCAPPQPHPPNEETTGAALRAQPPSHSHPHHYPPP